MINLTTGRLERGAALVPLALTVVGFGVFEVADLAGFVAPSDVLIAFEGGSAALDEPTAPGKPTVIRAAAKMLGRRSVHHRILQGVGVLNAD